MPTPENTEDTEFLNKEITQAVIASAICVRKNPGQERPKARFPMTFPRVLGAVCG
jgi:hypothetical protein